MVAATSGKIKWHIPFPGHHTPPRSKHPEQAGSHSTMKATLVRQHFPSISLLFPSSSSVPFTAPTGSEGVWVTLGFTVMWRGLGEEGEASVGCDDANPTAVLPPQLSQLTL